MIEPIRGTGAARELEITAWTTLFDLPGLPNPTLTTYRPDGALHLLWNLGHSRLGIWFRPPGQATTWEAKTDGRRFAQGQIRKNRLAFDLEKLRTAIRLVFS